MNAADHEAVLTPGEGSQAVIALLPINTLRGPLEEMIAQMTQPVLFTGLRDPGLTSVGHMGFHCCVLSHA